MLESSDDDSIYETVKDSRKRLNREGFELEDCHIVSQYDISESRKQLDVVKYSLVKGLIKSFDFEEEKLTVDKFKFSFDDVINSNAEDVKLIVNSIVYTYTPPNSKAPTTVVVGDLSILNGCREFYDMKIPDNWLAGRLIIKADPLGDDRFILDIFKEDLSISSKSLELKNYVFSKLDCFLPLKSGDDLLFSREIEKLEIGRYKMFRDSSEITEYLKTLSETYTEKSDVVYRILSCDPMWHFLSNFDAEKPDEHFMDIIAAINNLCTVNKMLPTRCLQLLLEGDVMKYVSLQTFLRNQNTDLVEFFFDSVFAYLPSYVKHLLKIFDNDASSKYLTAAGKAEKILLNFNKNLLKLIYNKETENVNSVLTPSELKKGMLFKNSDAPLKVLRTNSVYQNAEDYISTYSRLLRAECFHGLQSGIQDFVNGDLNTNDIHLYFNVTLKGYKINHFRTELCISFDTPTSVLNWRKSNMLMHGNILAISCNCCFDDVIWATIGTRDHEYLEKKQIIFIQILDANKSSVGDIVQRLLSFNGQAAMIESPNYYQSFKSALKNLSCLNMDTLSIRNVLLYGAAETFDDPTVSRKHLVESAKGVLQTLEKSQRKAFLYALNHKIAVVQGPPGTGKTYMGAKIVEYLLGLNLASPILIVTYKNHALDEFLKHVLKFVRGDKLLRLGSKCKDEMVLDCTLNGGNHTYKAPYMRFIRDKIEKCEKDVENIFQNVYKYSRFNFGLFVSLNDMKCFLRFITTYVNKYRCDDSVGTDILEICQTNTFTDDQYEHISKVCWNNNERVSSEHDPSGNLQKLINIGFDAFIEWLPDPYKLQDSKTLAYPNIGNSTSALYSKPKLFVGDDLENEMKERRKNDHDDSKGIHEKDLLFITKTDAEDDSIGINDFPPYFTIKQSFLDIKNVRLWDLDDKERYQLIFSHLKQKIKSLSSELNNKLTFIEALQNEFISKGDKQKAQYFRTLKVIGATITGAALQSELLSMVAPEVVIVEEAAEILEPSLLACLNPSIKRLIMIGDHEQLKPSVDVYELRRNYKFDTSLLERLVKLGYPYRTLQRQARMRSEFSAMMLDIYPKLQNMEGIDDERPPFLGITCNRFWWDHRYEEQSMRSPSNIREANMVMALAMYLVMSGTEPSSITILVAYSGQLQLMRNLRRQLDQIYTPDLRAIEVRTIDEYQGDENDFVIISLVRSNSKQIIGFLSERQRRCVSQSRARRGLYYVANSEMFRASVIWESVVDKFIADDCFGEMLSLQCHIHQRQNILVKQENEVVSRHFPNTDLMHYVRNPEDLCSEPCLQDMPCQIKEHKCTRKCLPAHSHEKCSVEIEKVFMICGHRSMVECSVYDIAECDKPCPMKMSCKGEHDCAKTCGHIRYNEEMDINNHLPAFCRAGIEVYLETCGHLATFECYSCTASMVRKHKCTENVEYTCEYGHNSVIECYQRDTFVCREKIYSFTFPLCQHKSSREKKCYEPYENYKCQQLVSYNLPDCGHEAPERKKCSDPFKRIACLYRIKFVALCGHEVVRKCCENEGDILCGMPCEKTLKCGHVCGDVCHKPCNTIPCKQCEENFRALSNAAVKRIEKAKQEPSKANIELLERKSVDFVSVNMKLDMMTRDNDTKVKVEACSKIYFTDHLIRFEEKKLQTRQYENSCRVETALLCIDGWDTEKCDFYSTMEQKMLSDNQLVLPTGYSHLKLNLNPGWFNDHFILLKDFSSTSHKLGKLTIIIFDIFLGKLQDLTGEQPDLIGDNDIDSYFTYLPSRVPIYAVKSVDQILPKYILRGELCDRTLKPSSLTDEPFTTFQCKPSKRVMKSVNVLYRPFVLEAEALFYKHFSNSKLRDVYRRYLQDYEVKRITIVVNKELEDRYFETKQRFQENGIPKTEIHAFHATDEKNVDNIIRNNLDPDILPVHGGRYGSGFYFSEFPFFSLKYGTSLLVFKILTGIEFVDDTEGDVDFGYNTCRKISRVGGVDYGEQLLLRDNKQFMPVYIIKCEKVD